MKRDHVLKRLKDMGLEVKIPPVATFYIWLNLENLPDPINNGLTFFEELLKEKTIVIPGIFLTSIPHTAGICSALHAITLSGCLLARRLRISIKVLDTPPISVWILTNTPTIGLDAMSRVLRKVKKEGLRSFGHSYRRSIDDPASLAARV